MKIDEAVKKDNDNGWFNALARDLGEKIKECESLKQELEKVKKERVLLIDKIERVETELRRIMEKESVPVEWKGEHSGARSYCGMCGHYVSRFDIFCKRCGCVIKWTKRP